MGPTRRRSWHIVTAMRLHRCLLIACVTLCQACDSKPAAPPAAPVVTKIATVIVDDAGVRGTPIEGDAVRLQIDGKRRSSDAFDILLAAPQLVRGELVVDGTTVAVRFDKTAPDGPGMQVMLARTSEIILWSTSGTEGTDERALLVTKLDDPGKNTLRASLADIKTRTKAARIDAIIDRTQPMSSVAVLVATLHDAGYDVRLIAGAPTAASTLGMSIAAPPGLHGLLQDHEKPLRRCFEQALRRDGPMAGLTLEVKIVVEQGGRVSESTVGVGPQISTEMVNCVTAAVLAWKLSAPPGPYKFTLTFKAQ